MYAVLFISRNKDNKNVEGFHSRQKQFLTENPHDCMPEFKQFVDMGIKGEVCRYYISLSERNMERAQKMLASRLIMDDNIDLTNLDNLMVSIAMKPENELTKEWLFDFDCPVQEHAKAFLRDVWKEVGPDNAHLFRTIHGFAIEVYHGFDCRNLLEKWNTELKKINPEYGVSLQKNAMLLIHYATTQ